MDLRSRVEQAVTRAQPDVTFSEAALREERLTDFPDAANRVPRELSLADIDVLLARHRRLGYREGQLAGKEQGHAEGEAQGARFRGLRLEAAVKLLGHRLTELVDEAADVLAEQPGEGKRDRRTRAQIAQQVKAVLAGAHEIREVLLELADLTT